MKPEHIFGLALLLILTGAAVGGATVDVTQVSKPPVVYPSHNVDNYKEAVQNQCAMDVASRWDVDDTAKELKQRYDACLKAAGVMI